MTSEPAASPGKIWVWACAWGPGENTSLVCSRIRDVLCGAGAQGASRKEAAGEEVEGNGRATVRSQALSAGPFLPHTTQPNSPLLAGSDLHPVVFLAFSLQLSECTPHERGDAFIFVVEKCSHGRGNVTAGKSMGFEAQESWVWTSALPLN